VNKTHVPLFLSRSGTRLKVTSRSAVLVQGRISPKQGWDEGRRAPLQPLLPVLGAGLISPAAKLMAECEIVGRALYLLKLELESDLLNERQMNGNETLLRGNS